MFECKFPYIEDKSKYSQVTDSLEEAMELAKKEPTPCVVYSALGYTVAVVFNGKWVTIH